MAKKAYIGIAGKSRKIKSMYIGVGGVARKIKKAYIGIGGGARQFFGGGDLRYYGTAASTVGSYQYYPGANTGNYAVFIGTDSGIAFNNSLTKTTFTGQTTLRYSNATEFGGYAVINSNKKYYAINSSLTYVKTGTSANYYCAMARAGSNVLIFMSGGSSSGTNSSLNYGFAVDTSFTSLGNVSTKLARTGLVGCSAGNYAVFVGGWSDDTGTFVSEMWDEDAQEWVEYTYTGEYGYVGSVDAFNSSLTRTVVYEYDNSSTKYYKATSGYNAKFAVFSGDWTPGSSSILNLINSSLTFSRQSTSETREHPGAGNLGEYAIISGGGNSTSTARKLTYGINESGTKTTCNAMANGMYDAYFAATPDYGITLSYGTTAVEVCTIA